ncbi:hypothetical protein FRX31_030916 [Thalictrum thalictroides]|uniref:Uncharacterized protein n=1 Tax=Thalictrum thalictroides TaxID=46969 RepID=A0A7J6V3Y6_THATH|nr:hypothetical protein FRX31_030916 [Thalictrum thalictroides]
MRDVNTGINASFCTPKSHGGLGLRRIRVMNAALLIKWVWRFRKDNDSLWKQNMVMKEIMDGQESHHRHTDAACGEGNNVEREQVDALLNVLSTMLIEEENDYWHWEWDRSEALERLNCGDS